MAGLTSLSDEFRFIREYTGVRHLACWRDFRRDIYFMYFTDVQGFPHNVEIMPIHLHELQYPELQAVFICARIKEEIQCGVVTAGRLFARWSQLISTGPWLTTTDTS